jgi:hemoglobin/transferrin/lactoferrin receptor protein
MVNIRAEASGRVMGSVILIGLSVGTLLAEEQDKQEPVPLEEMVVTATRTEERAFDVPNTVFLLTAEDLQNHLSRTLPEALKETPGVMVQKTAHGQGSPYIRGFTGFRTLFLMDGIRLNNSVFRDGPNQYWNTIDPLIIQRLEVVKGPSSVLYGSDAIGGTVNAISLSREEYGPGMLWDRHVYYRYAGAENSHVGRAEVSGSADDRLGVVLGGSYRDFGDLHGGQEMGWQPKTGYDEWDVDFRADYFLTSHSSLTFAHQQVHQDDAWRTHTTAYARSFAGTTVGTDLERSLDQDRDLTYLRYQVADLGGLLDALTATVSWQDQEEEQFRIRSNGRSDHQGFDAETLGFTLQLESPSPVGRWTYGIEYYRDFVDSSRRDYNADGTLRSIAIQGPVGDDASYDLLGVYLQDDVPLFDERLDIIFGARFNYAAADADKVEDPETGDRISLSDDWTRVVGSVRAVYQLDHADHWHAFAGVSQGFRAPNLSDLTRLDTARTNEIETPSPGVQPEDFIAYEVGLKTRYENVSGQMAYFYTDIDDLIVRTPTGNIVDGFNEVTKKNAGDGYVHGIELGASWRFHPQFTAFGSVCWAEGYVDGYPTSEPVRVREPISRIQPTTTILGLRWEFPEKKAWVEFVSTLAAKQDKLSASDAADTQRIPPGGTPGYEVFTLRGGYRVTKDLTVTAAVENLSDEDYRIHGSGVNEPGTNVVLSADWTF